jgi:KDO2-lipid IV(A) lauroyltransferase
MILQDKLKKWQISYRLQAYAARFGIAMLGALPLDAASTVGGWLARKIGPLSGAHKTAVENLRRAMPEKTEVERQKIITAMWDNIGRTTAEYPHLDQLVKDLARAEIIDPENWGDRLAQDGIGALLIGMHYGNWELSILPGFRKGLHQYVVYRAPNNPFVDEMLKKLRAPLWQNYLSKGLEGARQAVKLLKQGAHIGMLVDQKLDEGIPVRFFGRDAMTTTAPASLARRLNIPIVTARVVRLQGARFRIFVDAVDVAKTADREADVIVTTKQISGMFENWIRENPEQWFWVHRRWPK